MPNIGNARTYTGPYGPNNYISDNPYIVLARDVNDRVILITLTTALGIAMTKTITRDINGLVVNVGRWIRT